MLIIIVILSTLLALSEASVGNILQNNIQQKKIPENGHLNFTQLVSKYGRKCEEFNVTTEDGYILKLFHITGNESSKSVLLMHGILDSADTFIIRGNISIAINLAEAGYDMWVGNNRGNKYSRSHVKLSPDKNKEEFWDYSFHEMAVNDLPATIDFILNKTGKDQLSAIAHSQGTTTFYVLGSLKPEYNKKISVLISLAPIAYLSDTSPTVSGLVKLGPTINLLFKVLGYEEVLQDNSAATELIQFICTQGKLEYDLCVRGATDSIVGDDPEELDPEFSDVLFNYFPAGTSRKALEHYVQIANSGRFAQYDYGDVNNRLVYKSVTSPKYGLSKTTMPIVLLAARNDALSGLKDVERLKSELANVVYYHVMEREKFNHIDYIWGKHLDVYMTPLLRDLLLKFS